MNFAERILGDRRLGVGGSLLVQVDLVDLLGHRQIVGVVFEQAPALVLGHEPHAVGQIGEGHRAADCSTERRLSLLFKRLVMACILLRVEEYKREKGVLTLPGLVEQAAAGGDAFVQVTKFTRRWVKSVVDHHWSCWGTRNERARH